MQERIVIIDGNSLINRAYYAMRNPMMTKEGIYTHAIYGFLNMLSKIEKEYQPGYLAVAWDLKAPTFRHKEYSEYKAGRKKMPIELAMQIPLMQEILEAKNITNLYLEGYEADDIIGTLARLSEDKGLRPLIITGDKDALQLAGDKTQVLITRKGISEFDLYDKDKMLEEYELTPNQFIDLKGLMGDQSDNIPGIPGVGLKTGINLLKQFGTIEEMLSRTDEISSPKLREKVEENANLARMSRRLAEIQLNVPLDINLEDLKVKDSDYDKLIDIYSRLEFNSFLRKMKTDGGVKGSTDSNDVPGDASVGETIEIPEISTSGLKIFTASSEVEEIREDLVSGKAYIKVFSDNNHINPPKIRGISILTENDGKYESYYITGSEGIRSLLEIINDNEVSIIGHGLVKDLYPLFMMGCPEESLRVEYDTEIGAYLIDPSRSGYSLKALAMEYFHEEIEEEKDFIKNVKPETLLENNDAEYGEYGESITKAAYKLKILQEREISKLALENVHSNVELPLIKVLASMEKEGFKVNDETLLTFGDELKNEIDDLTKDIHLQAGEEFNINSTQQLGEILFDKLGLPPSKKTKKGYSTGAEVLEKLYDDHPIIPMILRYRTLTKLNSTYVEGLRPLIGYDHKIRAHFQQTVTATGRISCTEPNLQNIPIRHEFGRQLRKAFVPSDENHILIGADYSQIELRVLAHLSGDESLIEAFNRGDDIHRATAARVFGIPYDEVTSLDRSKAKAVNFGVIYGMSGFGLSEELGITRKEAESFIKDYFAKHPKVKEYMDLQISLAKERGYTETIMGRRRYIPEIKASNFMVRSLGERLAMNSPIQGSAADIIKIAMAKVWNELKEKKLESRLILQVHDELIIDTLTKEKEQVEELLVRNMENAMELKVKLVSDLNSGVTWYDLK